MSEAEKENEEPKGPSTEERAAQMGWKPQDEYKGDSENWSDAEAFIKKGEDELPILRSNLRTLQTNHHKAETELSNMKSSMDKFIEMQVGAKLKEAKQKMSKAVEDGDVDAHKEAQSEYEGIIETSKPVEKKGPTETELFAERNPWFNDDFDKRKAALEYSEFLAGKGIVNKENFKQVEVYIDKKFKPKAPNLEGGGSKKSSNSKKGWSSIPQEAKKDLTILVNSLGKTEAEVADLYWSNQNG